MSSWIKVCVDEIKNIIEFIEISFHLIKIRVSVIGYRDHGDRDQFQIFPFSEDIDNCRKFISKLTAAGGNDTPEDIAGAFDHALKQDWTAQTKYAVLITDAPCHGSKYHREQDNYPKGDPNGLDIEEQIVEFAKKQIIFNAIKVTKLTDKMYKIFNDLYENFTKQPIAIADLGNSTENFSFFVSATLKNSVT